MSQDTQTKPDAFKAVLAAARSEAGRPELAHQSRGRPLSDSEDAFADALMEIYADGAAGAEAVAAALTQRGVAAPSTGRTDWTADSVAAELGALNADLDKAYMDNGFGA